MRLEKKTKKNPPQADKLKKKNPRKIRVYFAYARLAFLGIFAVAFCLLFFTNYHLRIADNFLNFFYKQSANFGFRLKEIVAHGRVKTKQSDILNAVELKIGAPILEADVNKIRYGLEKLEWVRKATVIRNLPDCIYIKISERKPIAIWKNKQKFYFIDEDGVLITDYDQSFYGKLPLFLGEGAALKAKDLIKILDSKKTLKENIKAFSRVRERRWNVFLNNNTLIKFSDQHLEEGLNLLEKLIQENKITDKTKELDMRFKDRFFIKVDKTIIDNIKNSRKGKSA